MTTASNTIVFENVSKFYGEVLGVNRVNLTLPPGVTSLVGPNGSGKTTLMNLVTGLVRPTQGRVSVLGLTPDEPDSAKAKPRASPLKLSSASTWLMRPIAASPVTAKACASAYAWPSLSLIILRFWCWMSR